MYRFRDLSENGVLANLFGLDEPTTKIGNFVFARKRLCIWIASFHASKKKVKNEPQ